MEYRKICNGIVIIKKFLSIEQQNELINKIINPIIDKKYFWKANGELNFMNLRGRHYCNSDDYEHNELLKNMSSRLMKIVQDIDITMPDCNPTPLLTLYYKTNRGIGWHKDNGSNDGDLDSLGLTMLVLALEEQIRQKTGKEFSLVNDSSFSELGDTFSSPLNLAMFIKTKIKDD